MREPGRTPAQTFILGLGAASTAALLAASWLGRSYYLLDAARRPLHESHALLRSSGRLGLPFGVLGLAMIALNLCYLVRRSLPRREGLGSLRAWMSLHVFTGLIGPLLILLHSAFLPRSPMGVLASGALAVVVVTGLVGRYIYARVPRTAQGAELGLAELMESLERRRADLRSRGVSVALPEAGAAAARKWSGVVAELSSLRAADEDERREFARLSGLILADPALAAHADDLLPLARRFLRERRWLSRYEELRALMGSWRFMHRWFAVVMLAIAFVHVVVAMGVGGVGRVR